jgi:ferredoxin-nitrite reductase
VLEGPASSRVSISASVLGGITGHRDFARDDGVICRPDEATEVADAIVRVFIDHGDRTNRNKARLKYVLDAWGFEKFLGRRGQARTQAGARRSRGRRAAAGDRPLAHIGVHPQKQAGLNWIGVVAAARPADGGADPRACRHVARSATAISA